MSKSPRGIIDLIEHVGEENVQVQNVMAAMKHVQTRRGGLTEIAFMTKVPVSSLMGDPPKLIGMVVWMPAEKAIERARQPAEERDEGGEITRQLIKWSADPSPLLKTGPRSDDPPEIFTTEDAREAIRLVLAAKDSGVELHVKAIAAAIARARKGSAA